MKTKTRKKRRGNKLWERSEEGEETENKKEQIVEEVGIEERDLLTDNLR